MAQASTWQGLVVVAGGGGFIGGHLVDYLKRLGWRDVRVVHFKDKSEWYQHHAGVEERVLDLRDAAACREGTKGASQIYNFAADMAGMGCIEQRSGGAPKGVPSLGRLREHRRRPVIPRQAHHRPAGPAAVIAAPQQTY